MKIGLKLRKQLFYRPHKSKFKSHAIESVFLIKIAVIRYLTHPRDAHFFLCGVLVFHVIAMKSGLYLLMRLLYRQFIISFIEIEIRRY
jgi:hypothetical protein